MGGTEPGHTTDAVATRLAIAVNADKCIIATNVEKVFNEDPRENPNAKSFDKLTHDELQQIVGPAEHKEAGKSSVVDPVAVFDAKKANIELNIIDGRKIERFKHAILGLDFEGTRIASELER
mgnify:FL=1